MNFALKLMNSVFKMMNFVFKMINCAFKMMNCLRFTDQAMKWWGNDTARREFENAADGGTI